ncbi:ferric-dicitrate binding protein FerR, regulates iron transport through sigma-19 [Paracidovorax cattleyae]|uniref:Ferric-dicitrate binding protein FerR, regulates iron transport through sigma-19 n=1 Tax=Paracidovorax cattleyae TaxID=80868 RepID=A0A1H0V7T9_9BURK|nr:ferric-dicitrate binding protein FerR, regulates iron transport through sigma-19 [Paracidovorax cattleyae]
MSEVLADQPAFEDLQQAADWFAVLHSDRVSEADRCNWQRWLETGPRQRAAWSQVGAVHPMARQVLEHRPAVSRRRRTVLRTLVAVPVTGVAAWMASRQMPWHEWTAALRTDTGEQRSWALADGSELVLNTASAADLNYSTVLRRIVLHREELPIASRHDPASPLRPLVVDVAHGRITALGTRFAVRYGHDGAVRVTVFEGAVQLRPGDGGDGPVLAAGQQARLLRDHVEPPASAAGYAADWQRGMLVADGMRLGDFIAELARYRRGHLGCTPEVAGVEEGLTAALSGTGLQAARPGNRARDRAPASSRAAPPGAPRPTRRCWRPRSRSRPSRAARRTRRAPPRWSRACATRRASWPNKATPTCATTGPRCAASRRRRATSTTCTCRSARAAIPSRASSPGGWSAPRWSRPVVGTLRTGHAGRTGQHGQQAAHGRAGARGRGAGGQPRSQAGCIRLRRRAGRRRGAELPPRGAAPRGRHLVRPRLGEKNLHRAVAHVPPQ